MNWVSSNCRTLSALLYPYRFYFLAMSLVGVCLFNLLNYQYGRIENQTNLKENTKWDLVT